MNAFEAHEENVKRLYPQLIEMVEGEDPADAGTALCLALTLLAWRRGYCLDALLFMTRDTIKQSWRELSTPPNREEEDGKA